MKFSLICATINKTKELQRLLESLANQSYKDFELIVIDQNRDSRLRKVLSPYLGRFRIIHFNSSPGLSSSRNLGIREANGNIVAFPDDDCWYPADLLGRIVHMFRNKPEIDIFTGRSVDENGMPSGGRWGRSSGRLNRYNIWTRGLSITIFLRASVVRKIGMFDESLGLRAGTGLQNCWVQPALPGCPRNARFLIKTGRLSGKDIVSSSLLKICSATLSCCDDCRPNLFYCLWVLKFLVPGRNLHSILNSVRPSTPHITTVMLVNCPKQKEYWSSDRGTAGVIQCLTWPRRLHPLPALDP